MTDNGISLEDKLNDTADDISLEAILAEYGDFGLGVPPSDEVGARSRRIVMEALGETFTGAATSAAAEGTEGLPAYDDGEAAREYRPRRARKSASRRREREHEEAREYRPRRERERYEPARYEPAPSPAVPDEDDDVKVYRPGMGRALPEGDEDVKVYNLGDVIAEAERRSANWKVSKPGDEAGFIERLAEPAAPVYGTERVFEPDGEAAYVPEPEPEYSPEPEYITEPEPEQYRPDAFENIRTGGYGPEDEDADYAAEGSEDVPFASVIR